MNAHIALKSTFISMVVFLFTSCGNKTISNKELARYCKAYPISRAGTPDEVGRLTVFLASDDAAYITGAALDINGGDLML